MSASAIRDAIFARVTQLADYNRAQKAQPSQLQPDDLPALTVWTMTDTLRPDGDGNAGSLHFIEDASIGVSLVRGFQEPSVLDGQIDADMESIRAWIFTDPAFVSFNLFESIESVTARKLFPQTGETYACELRMELAFRWREDFEPTIPDDYEGATIKTRPLRNPDAPQIEMHIDEDA